MMAKKDLNEIRKWYTMNNQSNEKNMDMNRTNQSTPNIRWMLVGYDLVVYAVVAIILLVLYGGMDKLSSVGIFSKLDYLSCAFLQHVSWVKFMDKCGDMVGFSAISACCLLILSHL